MTERERASRAVLAAMLVVVLFICAVLYALTNQPSTMSSKRRILIVEDDESIRDVVGELLREEGYAVEEAVDGGDGFRAIRAQAFDGVLLDIGMPFAEGPEMLDALIGDGASLPIVIIVSALSRAEAERRLHPRTPPFIHKPFSGEVLMAAVQKHIGSPIKGA